MSNVIITLPDPANYISSNSLSLAIACVLILAGILASVTVEVYRRHYNAKKQEELAKKWIAIWLAASSGVFTALGYLVFIIQANTSTLSALPFVGKHVAGVVGIGYFLYNVRLNKWYKAIAARLVKWTGAKVQTSTVVQPSLDPAASVSTEQFLGQ